MFAKRLLIYPFQNSMRRPCTDVQANRVAVGIIPAGVFDMHGVDVGGKPNAVALHHTIRNTKAAYLRGNRSGKLIAIGFKSIGYREFVAIRAFQHGRPFAINAGKPGERDTKGKQQRRGYQDHSFHNMEISNWLKVEINWGKFHACR